MTAIIQLRRERSRRRGPATVTADLLDRFIARTTTRFTGAVADRGGETSIGDTPLRIADRADGLVLLHVEGWRQYSRSYGVRYARLSYLCGHEDGQDWAVRVPGTITDVRAALAWLEPAAVWQARHCGQRVVRQGDLYAIETTGQYDGLGDVPDRHTWDPATRILTHPQHPAVTLPYPVRFVPQRAYLMGRATGRGAAD